MKIRIKFAKQGTMKFIGHLDVMHKAASFLIEKETITGEEFMKIVRDAEK